MESSLRLMKPTLATPKQVRRTKVTACTHSRMVDDVLTTKGTKTGRLVCTAVFPDPSYEEPDFGWSEVALSTK